MRQNTTCAQKRKIPVDGSDGNQVKENSITKPVSNHPAAKTTLSSFNNQIICL